jgi:hypothetical protein
MIILFERLKVMDKKSRKQMAEEGIGLGALAQLSRNKKINNLGWLGIYVGVITLIGELIKFLIIKPCMFCIKVVWKIILMASKYIFIYGSALLLTIIQYINKGIKILFEKYKEKNQV